LVELLQTTTAVIMANSYNLLQPLLYVH
jgi:hypothetical protein